MAYLATPDLHVLIVAATSQKALGVHGEHTPRHHRRQEGLPCVQALRVRVTVCTLNESNYKKKESADLIFGDDL